jgi:hypothetical protein
MRVSQLVSGLSVEEQQPIEEQLKLWDDSSIWEILWKKGAGGIGIDRMAERFVDTVYERVGVESIDHLSELEAPTDWRLAKLLKLAEHTDAAFPKDVTVGALHNVGLAIEKQAVARLQALNRKTWVDSVVKRNGGKFEGSTIEDLVRHTMARIFEQLQKEFEKLDPEKQREVVEEIESALKQLDPEEQEKLRQGANLDSLTADALMRSGALASLGVGLATLVSIAGFGAYTALTTIMATLAGAFGLTLPFGAYIAATSLLAFVTNPLVLVAGGGAVGYALTRSTNRKIRDNLMCILVSTSYLSASGAPSDDGAGLARRLVELVGEYRNGDNRRRARLQKAYPGLDRIGGPE